MLGAGWRSGCEMRFGGKKIEVLKVNLSTTKNEGLTKVKSYDLSSYLRHYGGRNAIRRGIQSREAEGETGNPRLTLW